MRIFDIEWWNEIFQSLGRNKRRSIFTALGVVWGTFMLVLILGVGIGISDIMMSSMKGSAAKTTIMFPMQTSIPYKGMKSGRWWSLRYSDVLQIKGLEEIEYAGARGGMSNTPLIYNGISHESYITGCDLDYIKIDGITVTEGRNFNKLDMTGKRKVCLIPQSMAARIGGNSVIGKDVKIGSTYFRIIGSYVKTNTMFYYSDPDKTVIIPYTTDNYLFKRGSMYVDTFAFTGKDGADHIALEKKCKRIIAENHLISPDDDKAMYSFNAKEMVDKVNGLFSGIIFLTWFVGAGTLLAGIIGISNIMLIIVRERRQEIGVRRALGARPGEIIGQILAESTVLSLLAGITGMTLALMVQGGMDKTLLPMIVEDLDNTAGAYTFQLPFTTALTAFAIILAGSLAAGILPAYKAIEINAVDALREE